MCENMINKFEKFYYENQIHNILIVRSRVVSLYQIYFLKGLTSRLEEGQRTYLTQFLKMPRLQASRTACSIQVGS